MNKTAFVFFGAGPIAEASLESMKASGMVPALVVTTPDRPAGRGKEMSASPVGVWASQNSIETIKPEKLDDTLYEKLKAIEAPVFVVIDYGVFLPDELLAIPARGVLNMHPSLLPRLRGPSPIRSSILTNEEETGVSVMLVDSELDHGPIVAQKKVAIPEWPPYGRELDALLAREGGALMAEMLPLWESGEIEARVQNHDLATYTEKFSKEDGLLDLKGDAYPNLLKIRAFDGWPGTYAFFQRDGKRFRVQILDAHIEGKKLILDRVKPEGKGEMNYADFERGGATLD